jgi:hypothetical protein
MNGAIRFEHEGTWVLGVTLFSAQEAILFKCPWTYSVANGGGEILQRFGSSAAGGVNYGITDSDGEIEGLHNLYYNSITGTLTVFANA